MQPQRNLQQLEKCSDELKNCLQLLERCGHILLFSCDDIIKELTNFAKHVSTNDEFRQFNPEKSRLDSLYYDLMASSDQWPNLWSLIQKVLLLSHGQAAVERGFSINNESLTDSPSENTLVTL